MKRCKTILILLALLAGVGLPLSAQTSDDEHQAQASPIAWEATTYDFGSFSEDVGKVEAVFRGVNLTADTVVVVNMRATCGCTTPTTNSNLVAPGDTLEIRVIYNPTNRPGPFEKRVTVNLRPGDAQHLYVAGRVMMPAKAVNARYPRNMGHYNVQDGTMSFGTVYDGYPRTSSIKGVNNNPEPVTPTVVHLPKWLEAETSLLAVSPGDKFAITIKADPSGMKEYGYVADSIGLSSKEHPEVVNYIQASALHNQMFAELTDEEYAAAPSILMKDYSIDFERIDTLATKPVVKEVEIANSGQKPMKIIRVYTLDDAVKLSVDRKEVKADKTAKLKITVDPTKLRGRNLFDARVVIITNSPADPNHAIRLVGQLGIPSSSSK